MNLDAFYNPAADAAIVSFTELGTAVEGTILGEPEFTPDKFNPGEQVLVIPIGTADGPVKLFARKRQLSAIGTAVKSAGAEGLTTGSWLRLEYTADRETPNGVSKVWQASYAPFGPIEAFIEAESATPDW
jgi:hypothetical protein